MSMPQARRAAFRFEPGDAAPPAHGVTANNVFYSLEAQAGRPAALLIGGFESPATLGPWLAALEARREALAERECDVVVLLDMRNSHARAFGGSTKTVFCESETLQNWGGEAPLLVLIDRAAHIVAAFEEDAEAAAEGALARVRALSLEAPRADALPAPVLVIPDLFSPDFCRELIAHFEASPHQRGGMAGRDAEGKLYHKVDEAKKKRMDFVLGPKDPMLAPALNGIIRRCLPEVRKAFQVDVRHTDRILLALYDEGGYFLRHRDNAAPGVEFRQFALSINLNADYDGGCVIFPEYNSRLYRPATGAGVVFSCSLLHEATPVTRGSRYALLTFLHDAAAQARWMASQRRP